jgi:hypothetical protein
MIRPPRLAPLVLALLLAPGARPAFAADATAPVSYLSGGSVYVDAGAAEGLKPGDTLSVLRGGKAIARVRVTFASSHRAACDTLWTSAAVAVGDVVRYTALAPAPRDTAATAAPAVPRAAPAAPASAANRQRLRGRAGVGWLSVNTTDGGSFQQPSLALRFDGTNVGGGHGDFTFDLRSRRTTRSFAGTGTSVENVGRVYRAALTLHGDDPGRRLTLGRQSSPTLASVSLFDGALIELGDSSHTFGLFAGTQPDAVRYRYSSDIVQGGGFFEFHQKPFAPDRWSLAVGGVTSMDHGHPNRDFAFGQGWWFSKALTASLTQEIDVNRSWKRTEGQALLSMTSTFASANAPLTKWFALSAGYDNRRNVRLYRDRLTPETEFDDTYRQGAWVGGQFSIGPRARLGGDTRANAGGGRSNSWSIHGEAWGLGPLRASLHGRYSQFTDTGLDSRLQSMGLAFEPFRLSRVDVSGGVRSTRNLALSVDEREQWVSIDTDLTFGRAWYLGAGWERDHGGGAGDTKQLQASLNRRF